MNKLYRNNRVTKEELLVDETIYSQANGFLGTRGTFIEGYGEDFEYNQTYLNGFYDKYNYFYEENLFGFPQMGQKLVNLIDGQKIIFLVEGIPLNINNCEVISLIREYDLEKGLTIRKIHYRTKQNYEFILTERKLVSTKIKELIAVEVLLESINYNGTITVKSYLEESIKKHLENDPRLYGGENQSLNIVGISKKDSFITVKTLRSNLIVHTKMIHNTLFKTSVVNQKIIAEKEYLISPKKGIKLDKYLIYTSSLYHENYLKKSEEISKKVAEISFEKLIEKQKNYYNDFWKKLEIKIPNNKYLELLINYNIYQLNSSGGESEYHNISAKGLSGEGYEGHYFWDTEIYMIPFFILTNPLKARNLLMYRFHTMEQARVEARNLGYDKGVKFPWRTINGEEASPYYPAGSAQFHINSDIAYTIIKYFEATNDLDFIIRYGFEMLVETARFLKEAVNFNGQYYHLNGVTGPDEYTTVVDDNYYTNQLLKYHFEYVETLYGKYTQELSEVIKKIKLIEDEVLCFKEIAKKIYLPFDENLNIFIQDASFLNKKKLDLTKIPSNKFPLLMHFHPLFLYKHQVLKQADTMLSMMLLDYDNEKILNDSFDYYESITTHDSSLSKCVYSILAFKLKKYDLANDFFENVLETDLLNSQKNTSHGLHVANMGGSYIGFVYGIVGLRIKENYLVLNPLSTEKISSYELNVQYKGKNVNIIAEKKLTITTKETVKLKVYGKEIKLNGRYQTTLKKTTVFNFSKK